MQWSNWSGRHKVSLDKLAFVRSEEDAAALIRQCTDNGKSIRIAGAGHSHSPVVANDAVIMDASGLAGVLDVDTSKSQAWVRAGSSIFSLGTQLHRHGMALRNQGDIDRQLLGGVIATGTHGTGRNLQNIPAAIEALDIILASGERVTCSADDNADLFEVARLGVGSVGFISQVLMQCRPSVVLKEHMNAMSYDEVAPRIPDLVEAHERFEFFWYPGNDQAQVKLIDPVDEPPVYPLADEGQRQAWSFEVLPSHRPHLHTEMEYSIPREKGPDCFRDIRELIRSDFPDVQWPVEYRTVAEDNLWLSMAYGRPTVTLSVHQDIRIDEEPYYRACEEIFLSYEGRPHWGKVHYLSNRQAAAIYPRWQEWWQLRDEFDPTDTFLNSHMKSLAPR